MKKSVLSVIGSVLLSAMLVSGVSAATHTVISGDSMWKIAVKYEVGVSEIKDANPQIANPDLIYPGQVLNIPETDAAVLHFEKEVVRLVNEIRAAFPQISRTAP